MVTTRHSLLVAAIADYRSADVPRLGVSGRIEIVGRALSVAVLAPRVNQTCSRKRRARVPCSVSVCTGDPAPATPARWVQTRWRPCAWIRACSAASIWTSGRCHRVSSPFSRPQPSRCTEALGSQARATSSRIELAWVRRCSGHFGRWRDVRLGHRHKRDRSRGESTWPGIQQRDRRHRRADSSARRSRHRVSPRQPGARRRFAAQHPLGGVAAGAASTGDPD